MQIKQNQAVYYRCSYLDDLFFFAIPISARNKDFWRNYFASAHSSPSAIQAKSALGQNKESKAYSVLKEVPNGQAGVRIFKQDPDTQEHLEQWIVLASQIDIKNPYDMPLDKIEMTMIVTTSLNANFTAHMGISRTYDSFLMETTHPRISMPTHAFSAAFTIMHYGNAKDHVKCSPVETMREAFKKGMGIDSLDKYLVSKDEKNACMKHVWFKKFRVLSSSQSLMKFQLAELAAFLPNKCKVECILINDLNSSVPAANSKASEQYISHSKS